MIVDQDLADWLPAHFAQALAALIGSACLE